MIERLAIQFNENTLKKIVEKYPEITDNYTEDELAELCSKREILVTRPEKWYNFMVYTAQEFLKDYGTASPDIEKTFVRVTKVA